MEFKLSENQLTKLLVAHFRKLQISQNTDFSFRKIQIFISQITDFAKYRFSFHFANYSRPWRSQPRPQGLLAFQYGQQLGRRPSLFQVFR